MGDLADTSEAVELRVVGHDDLAVARQVQIDLDHVGPHLERELVGRQRILGAVAGGSAVRDHAHACCSCGARLAQSVAQSRERSTARFQPR